MIRFLKIIIILLFVNISIAQTIPSNRIIDWSIAGFHDFNLPSTFINVLNQGLDNTGALSNDSPLTTILNNIGSAGAVIYFPDGDYLFNQSIILKSNIVLKGESTNGTIFNFNLGGINNCIELQGSNSSIVTEISGSLSKGQNIVNVTNASQFSNGDFVILSDNDSSKITSSWAINTTGQILEIINIIGNEITFRNSLRRDYYSSDFPKITKINPKKNISLEKFTINRLDATTSQTSNIFLNSVYNARISCIKSINTNYAHVLLNRVINCSVEGSYFQDGFSYSGGGKAYGVVLQGTTGESIIYNNIFKHLRHSILLQSGANGNVISYNYSREPYWVEPFLPSNSAGDLVLHGNYPYLNLFEGNIVQNIVIDDSHGMNGPYNTFHRNRAELYGLFMNNNPASNKQNFSSNEITNTGFLLGNYTINGIDHFQYNNNKNGTILPNGTFNITPNSYYLNTSLNFYNSNSYWPPIGNASNYNIYTNEAKSRFVSNNLIRCSTNETLNTLSSNNKTNYNFFPNPANEIITIKSSNDLLEDILIYSLNGLLIKEIYLNKSNYLEHIDISDLNSGQYIIVVNNKKWTFFFKK